jgi:hypothetical protein
MSAVLPFSAHKIFERDLILDAGSGTYRHSYIFSGKKVVKLDIDKTTNPDIVGDMRRVDEMGIGKFDGVVSIHALEHLYPHEVVNTLTAFRNVLNDGGSTLICVPDLEDVRPTLDILYDTPIGPVCGLDMYYGHSRLVSLGKPEMAHHCGFTEPLLREAMEIAGYSKCSITRYEGYNLIAIGDK